jgi:hypothetical protein
VKENFAASDIEGILRMKTIGKKSPTRSDENEFELADEK